MQNSELFHGIVINAAKIEWLRFNVQLDVKQIILETTFTGNLMRKQNITQWKQPFIKNTNKQIYTNTKHQITLTTTTLHPFYRSLDFVPDYVGKPIPER